MAFRLKQTLVWWRGINLVIQMIFKFLFLFIVCGTVFLLPQKSFAESISFDGQGVKYKATLKSTSFQFSDQLGIRSIPVTKCNKKIINSYWKTLRQKAKAVNQVKLTKKKNPFGTLRVGTKKKAIAPFDPRGPYFLKLPEHTHSIFRKVKRVCG